MIQLAYKYYEYMNMIVATNHALLRRMDKWFINYIQWSIINHINPHHQSASWPVKWGDLLPPLMISYVLHCNHSATWYPEYIIKSPKIFAPQKVPKNFACSFLSFDKQKYYLHMTFGPPLLLLKRFFVSLISAEMMRTLKCHN